MPAMRIWMQDPSTPFRDMKDQGTIEIDVGRPAEAVFQDAQLDVHGLQALSPEDFLIAPDEDPSKLEVVHSYAVARLVVDMYEASLRRDPSLFPDVLSPQHELLWSWNQRGKSGGPLNIYPRAGTGLNAFFSHAYRALRFQYFPSGNVFACRSLDLVAHEVGHAVLDALKPGWWRASLNIQTSALHESFGDLTIIFLFLFNDTLIEHLRQDFEKAIETYRETNPDDDLEDGLESVLFDLGLFVLNIGEELARARNAVDDTISPGLRHFHDKLKLSTISNRNSAHSLSRVFTKAICLIIYNVFIELSGLEESGLVNAFVQDSQRGNGESNMPALKRSGEIVTHLLLATISKAPAKNASFRDVAEEMCQQAEGSVSLPQELSPEKLEQIIREEFTKCEILGEQAAQRPQFSFPQWCGTLSEAHSNLTWPMRHLPKVGKPKRYSRSRLPISSL